MDFFTQVKIEPLKQTIVYDDGLLFLGSCFAEEIGNLCRGLGFKALVNPFGTLYNPLSISQFIQRLQAGTPFTSDEIIKVGEEYYCTFSHNTDFWCASETILLDKVNHHLAEAHKHLSHSKWVIVSLGTSWVYRRHDTQEVVANCHKLPASQFERSFLSARESAKALSSMVSSMPDKQFIFTVSPLRHLKDGLHENQLSKASLLLAVDEVCKTLPNVHYFPAYEIMMDELRDYRFFKEDMIHPNEQAIRYIFEKFIIFAVNFSENPAMKAARELRLMLDHKPMFPESEAFRKFEALKAQKIVELKEQYNISLNV